MMMIQAPQPPAIPTYLQLISFIYCSSQDIGTEIPLLKRFL